MRIAVDKIVDIRLDAHTLEAYAEVVGGVLSVVMGDDYAAYHEAAGYELATETQDVFVVCDAEVGTDFILYDVFRADDDDDLYLIADLAEHTQFAVGLEAWQYAAGVMVVEELAAEFEVKLALELLDALLDVLRLDAYVFFVIESLFHYVCVLLGVVAII